MSTCHIVHAIAREVSVTSPCSAQLGRLVAPLPRRLARLIDRPERWERAAAAALGRLVYDVYYLGERARADQFKADVERVVPIDRQEHLAFARLLREANRGSGWVSSGWRLAGRDQSGRWQTTRGSITVLAREDDLVPEATGPLTSGDTVGVRFPKHLPYLSPGYYTAVADAGPPDREIPAVRMYVNVAPSSAPALLHRITTLLSSCRINAIVKVLNHPHSFTRPDSMVLYLQRDALLARLADVQETLVGASGSLRSRVPAFTKPWLPGIGIAEEPVVQEPAAVSFGEHRSSLIGRGLARAYLGGGDQQSRLTRVWTTLEEAGLDPSRLYLNPGSPDVYPPTS